MKILTETRKLSRTVVFPFLADPYGLQCLSEIHKRISTFTVGGRLQNASQLCTLRAHSYTKYTGSFTVGERMSNWNYAFKRVFIVIPRALVP